MTEAARLLFPAIRWDPDRGDWDDADRLHQYADLGVGGFILFGGPVGEVADLTAVLRSSSRHPILVGADLERGAGQQFDGATPLPPAGALAALDDLEVTRRAGAVTGREAVALGVDWVYAPVADLDVEPANPIVGTRAFGAEPDIVARHVRAWVEGCRSAGAMATAKHFPGHGRTTADSHTALPVVDADASTVDHELAPFRSAIEAGVDAIMTAHVAFPALDPSGAPATLSAPILEDVLRDRLRFDGLVVTDALIMEGVADGGVAADPAVRAVAAGCDVLLYPPDAAAAARALEAARGATLPAARVADALGRVGRAAGARRHGSAAADDVGRAADRAWALRWARRAVHTVRGRAAVGGTFELVTVDDDVGGPWTPASRSVFPETLRKAGRGVIAVEEPAGRPAVVAVYADVRGFKGRAGLSDAGRARVTRAVERAPSSLVVLFGHPRLAADVPGENVVCAWGGEPLMQEAAATELTRTAG